MFRIKRCLTVFVFCVPLAVQAEMYYLQKPGDSIIGEVQSAVADPEHTLLDIARNHGLGYHDIKLVNPELDTWLPDSRTQIILPTEFILPAVKHEGIVLNIPEMRLYYFPSTVADGEIAVLTYPLGIGREGWSTPYVATRIVQKQKHPFWFPPESIRREHEEAGDPLPKRVGPGPDNPLGDYAMRLGLREYLIHGTNKPWGIGMRVSHGCIRLYPEDIEELFSRIKLGTKVRIVNEPYKIGARNGDIYLEAHPFLEEDAELFEENLTSVVRGLVRVTGDRPYHVDWHLAKDIIREAKGTPIRIGRFIDTGLRVAAEVHTRPDNGDVSTLQLQLETRVPSAN